MSGCQHVAKLDALSHACKGFYISYKLNYKLRPRVGNIDDSQTGSNSVWNYMEDSVGTFQLLILLYPPKAKDSPNSLWFEILQGYATYLGCADIWPPTTSER